MSPKPVVEYASVRGRAPGYRTAWIPRRRRRTIILIALGCGFVFWVLSVLQPRSYEAHATVEVGDGDVQTQIRIMQSAALRERAALQVGTVTPAQTLRVTQAGATRIADVAVDAPAARLAADLANALCGAFVERNPTARVVDAARPPLKASKPHTVLNTLMGLLAGLIFAVGFVFVQERADQTFREPGAARTFLGVRELGFIPKEVLGRRKRARIMNPGATSLAAEGYRDAAASLLFTTGNRRGVFVVTSGALNEGKTAVCGNLAVALSEQGLRALVVDADLRAPLVHESFGVDNEPGLLQLLESGSTAGEAVRAAIKAPKWVRGVWVLPSGGVSAIDASLMASAVWPRIVEILRQEYDVVLIDTPPLLGVPTARIAGRLADGVVLSMRAGKTTRQSALASCTRLDDDGVTLTGTILMDVDPRFAPGGPFAGI